MSVSSNIVQIFDQQHLPIRTTFKSQLTHNPSPKEKLNDDPIVTKSNVKILNNKTPTPLRGSEASQKTTTLNRFSEI